MSKTTKPDCEYQSKKYKEGQIPSIFCQYKETEGIYYIDCDYEQEEEECPIKKLLEGNRRLKGQLEQATKSTINNHSYASDMENKVIELESKLRQSEEVLDEANNLITDYLCSEEYCSLDVSLIADFFMKLQQVLQRYKGDNK